jgi:hypothetical protein
VNYLKHSEWQLWLDFMDTVMCEIVMAFYIGNDMNLMLIDNYGLYFMRFGLSLISFLEQSC